MKREIRNTTPPQGEHESETPRGGEIRNSNDRNAGASRMIRFEFWISIIRACFGFTFPLSRGRIASFEFSFGGGA